MNSIEDIYSYHPADELYNILLNDFDVKQNKAIQMAYLTLSDQEVDKALTWAKQYLADINYKESCPSSISTLLIEETLQSLHTRLSNEPGISNVSIYSIRTKTETTYLNETPIESEWSQSYWRIEIDWCFYDSKGKYIGDHHPLHSAQDLVYKTTKEIRDLTNQQIYLQLTDKNNKYEFHH